MDLQPPQEPTEMQWLRKNFWLIIAVTIITVSMVLGLLLACICRWLLRRDKTLEIAKSLKQKRREEMVYENVFNQLPAQLPPLPPRRLLSPKDASSQETPGQPPATYSLVNKVGQKETVSTPSYFEPEDDYDDVEVSTNMFSRRSFSDGMTAARGKTLVLSPED
ncbi:PREDICTED: SLP adapter and CSK-interacting membrane protein [Condylura cristata]|uniref:SLP adapter and CSK-interacting membrane protein n=1 Tax=Condylura cristata TaxID=143302 RepID=UPI0006435DD7|nr:PREDICTED: SLP adapter and CSK-interacting membrane protein [Condylura cristata]